MSSSTYRDRGDGFCTRCGRQIGWHAGNACYAADATGMPAPWEGSSSSSAADYTPDQAGYYDNPPTPKEPEPELELEEEPAVMTNDPQQTLELEEPVTLTLGLELEEPVTLELGYWGDDSDPRTGSTIRADVSELELGDRIAGPHSWNAVVTITAVGEMLWADPFGRVSRDVWGTVEATGEPIRLQIKPGVPIPLIREEL